MSINIVIDSDVQTRLEKIAEAEIKHPTTGTHDLTWPPLMFRFSMVAGVPTLTLKAIPGRHTWRFADEESELFDDRIL